MKNSLAYYGTEVITPVKSFFYKNLNGNIPEDERQKVG
jgi:hypothetical protein